jgi:hypothetical protein
LEPQIEDSDQRSEVEIERDLGNFQNSCTIEDSAPRTPSPQPDNHSDIYEPLSPRPDIIMASPKRPLSPVISKYYTAMDQSATSVTVAVTSPAGKRTVDAATFYQPSTRRQYGKKKKTQANTTSPGMDVDSNERDEVEIVDNVPR